MTARGQLRGVECHIVEIIGSRADAGVIAVEVDGALVYPRGAAAGCRSPRSVHAPPVIGTQERPRSGFARAIPHYEQEGREMGRNAFSAGGSHLDIEPDYYPDSPVEERLMRAEFALMVRLRLRASLDGSRDLMERAAVRGAAIDQQWRTHQGLADAWVLLYSAYIEWEADPRLTARRIVRRRHILATGLDVMSPQELRSHRQARDLVLVTAAERMRRLPLLTSRELATALSVTDTSTSGQPILARGTTSSGSPDSEGERRPALAVAATSGAWPPSTTGLWTVEPFSSDLTDPCNPYRYTGIDVTWPEQVMRADFARAIQLGYELDRALTGAESDAPPARTQRRADIDALLVRTGRINDRYSDRPDSLGVAWAHLDTALADWRRAPDIMARALDSIETGTAESGYPPTPAIERRNLRQARELSDHLTRHRADTRYIDISGMSVELIEAAMTTAPAGSAAAPGPPPLADPFGSHLDVEEGLDL